MSKRTKKLPDAYLYGYGTTPRVTIQLASPKAYELMIGYLPDAHGCIHLKDEALSAGGAFDTACGRFDGAGLWLRPL